ncbi:hypothetical protein RvY_11504 [Ramazzottius varieornatus]|uniref:G-protein coupled receptors family 1 profile domain-containing protein n=1 Tax=Ramazzottius varieornatus TaxID=947166 RepID=A0A1D1VIE6_RAMVA|nr:hypothetical protein RvY_11504 [Ramazzottius varieornatus]
MDTTPLPWWDSEPDLQPGSAPVDPWLDDVPTKRIPGWPTSTFYSVLETTDNMITTTEGFLMKNGSRGGVGGNVTSSVARGSLSNEVLQQIAIMSFFMTVALLGNTVVLAYLCKTHGGKRPVTIFVMSLAITDICIALFSMSTEILWEAFGEWIFGNFTCKLSTYVQCLLFASTAFILMSMSFDRYEAICKPMAFTRTLSRSRRMVLLSWMLAAIVAIPQIFIFLQVTVGEHEDGTPKYACKSKGYTAEWQRKLYVTWLASYVFVIPLCFVAYCYIRIAMVIWRTTNQPSLGRSKNIRRPNGAITVDGSVEKAKTRTVQITICILSCYIFCWTPYFSVTLLNVWTNYRYKDYIPPAVRMMAQCLAWFSSCVNPFIYAIFNMPVKAMFNRCRAGSAQQKPLPNHSTQNGTLSNRSSVLGAAPHETKPLRNMRAALATNHKTS